MNKLEQHIKKLTEEILDEESSTSSVTGYLTPKAFKKNSLNEDKTEVDVPQDVHEDLIKNGFNTLNDLFKSSLRPNREKLSEKSKKWFRDVLLPIARGLKEAKKPGGGRRFIPKEFEFPSFLLEPISLGNDEPRKYFKIASKGNEYVLLVDPLVVTALGEVERGRTSFEKEQKLGALTRYIKEKVPQQIRGLLKKYSSGVKAPAGTFVPLSLVLTKNGNTYMIKNPSVGTDNIKPNMNNPLYEMIKETLLNEVSYNTFKKDISHRSKTEILHKGIKEIKRKLQEINRIVDYTSRIKQELNEGDGVQYWTRTEAQLKQVSEMVTNLNSKINDLNG